LIRTELLQAEASKAKLVELASIKVNENSAVFSTENTAMQTQVRDTSVQTSSNHRMRKSSEK